MVGGWENVGNKAQTQPSLAGAWAELGKTWIFSKSAREGQLKDVQDVISRPL